MLFQELYDMSVSDLRVTWTTLYKHTLPSLAVSRSPVQMKWPVRYDHCFARIILDAVIGQDAPWTTKLKAPAWKNMSLEQLKAAVDLAESIAGGEVNLVELDDRSLALRGKTKSRKRKRDENAAEAVEQQTVSGTTNRKALETRAKKPRQLDIRSSILSKNATNGCEKEARLPSPPATPAPIDAQVSDLIINSDLTPFRRRVLLALCQVPPGHFTTYAAMSEYLGSCARAVGNALRNNPFAPMVPCHRVVASGGGIGGFCGEWGPQGKHAGEKVRLLKEEGVRVDTKGEKLLGQVWEGFL